MYFFFKLSYSGQVDELRNPVENDLKTTRVGNYFNSVMVHKPTE